MGIQHPGLGHEVMVCTGDAELHNHLVTALSRHGYTVSSAQDAEYALLLLDGHAPDAMLCDLSLPDHDGMVLLQQIRRDRRDLAAMSIIVISDFGTQSDIVAGKLAGADDYLAKPIDIDLLLASLQAQLRVVARIRDAAAARYRTTQGSPRLHAIYGLLDRLSFGVELFDGHAELLFSNRLARSLSRSNNEAIRAWIARHAGRSAQAHAPGLAAAGGGKSGVLDFRMIPTGVLRGNLAQHLFVVMLSLTQPDDVETVLAAVIFPSGHAGLLGERLVADAIGLTPTETRLASLLAEGLRLEQIGQLMGIAKPTVNYHLRNIYQKSGVARQSEVISLLRAVHLADPPGTPPAEGSGPD